MEKVNFKAYTSRAKELENAIFTQKKLMEAHKALMEEQRPIKPTKPELSKPVFPSRGYNPKVDTSDLWMGLVFILCGLCGLFGLFFMGSMDTAFLFSSLILLILGGVGIKKVRDYANEKEEHDIEEGIIEKKYIAAQKDYEIRLKAYESSVIDANAEFSKSMTNYSNELATYNNECTSAMNRHESALSNLENALQALYDENVIFPKYRNMVAITTINEYLVSGRCFELEGPNGAYNLYEMELRQNIVIGQLATVVDNLDQIRNNQYSLYCEIVNTNNIVSQIVDELREIKTETKLNTYLSKITAMSSIAHNVLS